MRLYHLSSPVLLSIGVKLTWSGDGVGREWRWSWELSWSLAIMPCPISHQVASRSHVYPDNCFHQKSSEQCGHSNHWQWPPPAPAWPGHVTQCTGAGANGSDHQLHWSRWDTSFLLRHQRHRDNTSERQTANHPVCLTLTVSISILPSIVKINPGLNTTVNITETSTLMLCLLIDCTEASLESPPPPYCNTEIY